MTSTSPSDLDAFQVEFDVTLLHRFQRELLVSRKMVTEMLAAHFGEHIIALKLRETTGIWPNTDPWLLYSGEVTVREVLLRGEVTARNYVHAEARLASARLPEGMREALIATSKPLGELIRDAHLETTRELLRAGIERAGDNAHLFNLSRNVNLIWRAYRIWHAGKPLAYIRERFPESMPALN